MKTRAVAVVVSTLVGSFSCMSANSADLLGLYVGGAAGRSDVRMDQALTGTTHDVHEHDTGWKALIGIRPLPLVGAELEYADFGQPHFFQRPPEATPLPPFPAGTTGTLHSKAESLLGLLYAPIPYRFLDVFTKLGVARLHNDVDAQILGLFCPAGTRCGVITTRSSTTDLVFGAGIQLKFAKLALRGEYERIDSDTGSPDMLSVGLTWTL